MPFCVGVAFLVLKLLVFVALLPLLFYYVLPKVSQVVQFPRWGSDLGS